MIITAISWVFPSIDEEGVGSTFLHYQLWYQGVVDVPGNTPAKLIYTKMTIFSVIVMYHLNLGRHFYHAHYYYDSLKLILNFKEKQS